MSGCCGGKAAESVLGAMAENARYMTPEEAERYWPLERQGEGATATDRFEAEAYVIPSEASYVPATEHVWLEKPLKDSGEREQFPSGMVRDVRRGKGRYDLISPYTMRRLAKIMEKGCEKYGERNWEQGAPADRFLDSCLRHLGQWQMGMHDEDHLGQALWNLHCIVHFDEIEYGQTPDAENLTSSKGWHE